MFTKKRSFLLNSHEQNVEECDATGDERSGAAGTQNNFFLMNCQNGEL